MCEYDLPATDHCGTCTLCIEACPTAAIVEPYLLDASKCISYLTIEHRGDIPEAFAHQLEGWLFGCDICQDVCPWNERFAKPTVIREFYPHPDSVAPGIDEVARMSPEKFSETYGRSPVKRTKHTGFVRNAILLQQQRKDR